MSKIEEELIGKDALQLVLALPQLLNTPERYPIKIFRFKIYSPLPPLSERMQVATSQSVSSVAEALKHDAECEVLEMASVDLNFATMRTIMDSLPETRLMGLYSRCIFRDDLSLHIPMMDFHVEPSQENLSIIRHGLESMGQKRGAILESGRSYHFYGFDLMSPKDWQKFMGQCLLLAEWTEEEESPQS